MNWSDGSQTVETASWSSDNSTVATVDGTGKAHGVNSGEATLIATTTGHGTGTLKIRVVPNYQGTWTGDYTVRGCSVTGVFQDADFCGPDLFRPGTILPIVLAITQNGDKISGTLTLGQLAHAIDSTSSVAIDGGAEFSALGTFTDSGDTVVITLNPVNLRANGPTMTGTFTQNWTSPGTAGSATITCELNSVPRTATLMGPDFAIPQRFSSLRDLVRAIRQR